MKKFLNTLLICLLSIFAICGCSCKKENDDAKVALLIGDTNASEYIDLKSYDELKSKVTADDTFLLYVWSYCDCAIAFNPIINHVIQEKNLIVYGINGNLIDRNDEIYSVVSEAPALVLYQDGEVKVKATYEQNESYFLNYDGFNEFLDKYTYAPGAYYIDLETLNQKINNDETFVIFYDRSNCPFCKYLKAHYFKDYLKENTNKSPIYVINVESEGIRLVDGVLDETMWNKFKLDYGLTNKFSDGRDNPYGLADGFTPTMHYYKNGEISGAFIQSNVKDSILNEDGSTSYLITESYYADNPWIGVKQLSSEYNDNMASFYKAKLYEFLNASLTDNSN